MTNSLNTSKEIWKVSDIYRATFDYLDSKGIDDAKSCAEAFVMDALGIKQKHELYVMFNSVVSTSEKEVIRSFMKRRVLGEPLQYIIGKAFFYGFEFLVDERVLIPRGDTEHIVDAFAAYCKKSNIKVLDLCTGSGAIGISLKKIYKDIDVTLSDISEDAVAMAKDNIVYNGLVLDEVTIVNADALQYFEDDSFDVIVSNPPYVLQDVIGTLDTTVKDWEPHLALDGGVDGLDFYRDIYIDLLRVLKKNGIAIFEYGGFEQTEGIVSIFQNDFVVLDIIKDFNKIDRVVVIKRI